MIQREHVHTAQAMHNVTTGIHLQTHLHCTRNGRHVHGRMEVSHRSQEYNAVFFSNGIRRVLRHRIRSVARLVNSYFRMVFVCCSFNDAVIS
jgi:hypothetical protein